MINGVLLAKVTSIDWSSFMSSDLSILSIKVIEVVKASLLQYPFTFRWYFPLFERIYNLNLAWKISSIFKKYLGNEKRDSINRFDLQNIIGYLHKSF